MALIQSTAHAFYAFLPGIHMPYSDKFGNAAQKAILLGLACFGIYKILRPFYDHYCPRVLTEIDGWQIVDDPGAIKKAARAIQRRADGHVLKLESAIKSKGPMPIDSLADQIADVCPDHAEAGHFYRELKGHIFRILTGVAAVAGGSVARAQNTTSDTAALVGSGAAGLLAFFPLLGTPVAGGVRAAFQGLSLSTESSEWQALCRAAKLCSDSQEITLAAQLIAARITSRCAKPIATLSEKGAETLAFHAADGFRNHILYKWGPLPKDKKASEASASKKQPSWAPLDLARECEKISLAIQGTNNEAELEVKEALREITQVYAVIHILQLRVSS